MEYLGYVAHKKTTKLDIMIFDYGTRKNPQLVASKRMNLTDKQREEVLKTNPFNVYKDD